MFMEWHEVSDAESFMNLVKVYYGDLDGMLRDVEEEVEVGRYAKGQ